MDYRVKEHSISFTDPPKSILRNSYAGQEQHGMDDQRSVARMSAGSALNRHRVGVSPVRVKRSINDGVPTAVVTPSAVPISVVSTRVISTEPHRGAISSKTNGPVDVVSPNRYISLTGIQDGFARPSDIFVPSVGSSTPTSHQAPPIFGSTAALARRSRSSVGEPGFGLVSKRLNYEEFEDVCKSSQQQQHQQERIHNGSWIGSGLDTDHQVPPSNSILTLHSLDESQHSLQQHPRDDSQERRLKQLETRLREIESRMSNTIASKQRVLDEAASKMVSSDSTGSILSTVPRRMVQQQVTVGATGFGQGSVSGNGILSVAVPPMMALDASVFRVQPTPRSELKNQREMERIEKKLRQHEDLTETLRTQHSKQVEQLTRQLASNDDITQTLRSRIRELEAENELWQNRFRLYNDVDVAKILRENERLRNKQRRRSSRGSVGDEDKSELLRKKEQLEEEVEKMRSSMAEMDEKYRSIKDKYKESAKSYRTRRRQDHIELESLKVTVELQNAELAQLRERVLEEIGISSEAPPASVIRGSPVRDNEFVRYNLEKCYGITECLSKVLARLKRRQPLEPDEVLNYEIRNHEGLDEKSFDESIDTLAKKLVDVHSKVVDLYGDDLANSVTCNIQ